MSRQCPLNNELCYEREEYAQNGLYSIFMAQMERGCVYMQEQICVPCDSKKLINIFLFLIESELTP